MVESSASVAIRGGGIAAWCCAFLLQKAGIHVSVEETARAKLPAILLGHTALALIRDIFEKPDLFSDLPMIRKRIVAWGANAMPVSLDHSAIAVSEEFVLQSIRSVVPVDGAAESLNRDWTMVASYPLPDGSQEHRFGARTGFVAPVVLAMSSAEASCWIESLENGWLFLIEGEPGVGWLLAIGNTVDSLLNRSSVIEKRIAQCGASSGEIPVYPRISAPLCGSHWFACGSAAMAFDPICGDGTAHAIREAILAAAVIRAALQANADIPGLLSHYETRLVAGFRKHLAMCLEFYSRGYQTRWWQEESAALKHGLKWCDTKLARNPVFHYRLQGFELYPVR